MTESTRPGIKEAKPLHDTREIEVVAEVLRNGTRDLDLLAPMRTIRERAFSSPVWYSAADAAHASR